MLTPAHTPGAEPAVRSATDLFAQLQPHIAALDTFLHAQLADFEPEIREYASYCVDTGGKRIRPALVFFSGWDDGHVSPDHVRLAAVIEMVHLATLVHDDIMDGADVRRRRQTAVRAFGVNTAVLLGDALFAQALHVAAQFPTTEVCLRVAASTRQVCSGEIMQTLARPERTRDLQHYRRVIELKTAELFAVSCFLGARLGKCAAGFAEAAERFGRHLGTAYQMYDDLADFFGDPERIGKTLGTDLASGKSTLPLLWLLERLPPAEADQLRREMAEGDTRNLSRRVAEMRELHVFRDGLAEVHAENHRGLAALEPWAGSAAVVQLRALASVLEEQANALDRT